MYWEQFNVINTISLLTILVIKSLVNEEAKIAVLIFADVSLIVISQFESFDKIDVYEVYCTHVNVNNCFVVNVIGVLSLLSIFVINGLVNEEAIIAAFIFSDVSLIVIVCGALIKLLNEIYWL